MQKMGLEPLEFAECLTDSPTFREKLHDHEKELEKTSKAIKALVSDGRDVLNASKSRSSFLLCVYKSALNFVVLFRYLENCYWCFSVWEELRLLA